MASSALLPRLLLSSRSFSLSLRLISPSPHSLRPSPLSLRLISSLSAPSLNQIITTDELKYNSPEPTAAKDNLSEFETSDELKDDLPEIETSDELKDNLHEPAISDELKDDLLKPTILDELVKEEVDTEKVKVPLPRYPVPVLTVKERKDLASYAHSLGKKLKSQQVGKSGVTASLATSFVQTLEANELLKLKVHGNCPEDFLHAIKQLEESTGSVAVFQLGRTVILYRPSLSKMKKEADAKINAAKRKTFRKPPSSNYNIFQSRENQSFRKVVNNEEEKGDEIKPFKKPWNDEKTNSFKKQWSSEKSKNYRKTGSSVSSYKVGARRLRGTGSRSRP